MEICYYYEQTEKAALQEMGYLIIINFCLCVQHYGGGLEPLSYSNKHSGSTSATSPTKEEK